MKPMKFILAMASSAICLSSLGKTVEGITAIVNGSIITKSDVKKKRESLKSGQMVDDLLGMSTQDLLKDESKLLKLMIDERVLDEEVKKLNLNVTVEQIEQEINGIQSRNGIKREQLKEALKAEGVRFSDYQDFVKKRLERTRLVERAITSKIKISDDDVVALYEARTKNPNINSFEYKLAHILFRDDKASKDDAHTRAQKVYQKLKAGGDFEALASQYTEDQDYSEGGYLGTFRAGEFLKSMEEAVRNLSPGEFSSPVKGKKGYHILKLVERHIVPDANFEKQKESLRQELNQKAFVKQFQFWLDQKRQDSFIRIN